METNRLVSIFLMSVIFILQVLSLIHYLNRVNRDLANFLLFLQEDDTTLAYSKKRVERNFGNVIIDLDKIVKKLHQAGVEKVQQQHFLNAIVEQVNIGLLACTSDGKIDIINHAAKKLFEVNRYQNISVLTEKHPQLSEVFKKSSNGESNLIKISKQGQTMHLAVKTTLLKFDDKEIFLVSFDDIRSELEAQEIEAWRKLIRILRHEIMNSITPILTLTAAIRRSFTMGGEQIVAPESIDTERLNDALTSVGVIEERSKAMITFVEKFKNLTTPPALRVSQFSILRCFKKIEILFNKDFNEHSIHFEATVTPPDLQIFADEELVEQVLINLVKNSVEALADSHGIIQLSAMLNQDSKVVIRIIDNGIGIPAEYLDSIFIPSFTTKENGSGIGLSLSKQIMQLHQGSIAVKSVDKRTCFELIF